MTNNNNAYYRTSISFSWCEKKNVTQEEETAFPALIQLPAQLSEER